MKLSEKRLQAVYSAIREPIMDLRVKVARQDSMDALDPVELDEWLFRLETKIWHRVHDAMNLEGDK